MKNIAYVHRSYRCLYIVFVIIKGSIKFQFSRFFEDYKLNRKTFMYTIEEYLQNFVCTVMRNL